MSQTPKVVIQVFVDITAVHVVPPMSVPEQTKREALQTKLTDYSDLMGDHLAKICNAYIGAKGLEALTEHFDNLIIMMKAGGEK